MPARKQPRVQHCLDRTVGSLLLLVLLSTVLSEPAWAQGTLADYQRAVTFLPGNADRLVLNARLQPSWLPDSERFYYIRQRPDGREFVLVDPIGKTRGLAFDHTRVAAGLGKATGHAYTQFTLPFDRFVIVNNGGAIRFDVKDDQWTCQLVTGECSRTAQATALTEPATRGEVLSPDGRWAAFLRNHNLWVRAVGSTTREIQLTTDGTENNDYASHFGGSTTFVTEVVEGRPIAPEVMWSPDSTRLLTYRLDQRNVSEMHLLQSVPPQGVRPRLFSYRYPLPGDPNVGLAHLMVFDVERNKRTVLDADPQMVLLEDPIRMNAVWWGLDNQTIYYLQWARGYKALTLGAADVQSGSVRSVIDERASTPVAVSPNNHGSEPLIRVLGRGSEIIWYSERDGWGHLYLYDGKTGALKNQITRGEWAVRAIARVDEGARWVYFTAGGRETGQDPYEIRLYRIRLDGQDLQLLTPEEGNHTVTFSPSGKFLVDAWSRINTPPVTVLRSAEGPRVDRIGKLEQADISALLATGWRAPEPFRVKALDGATDLYGVIYRPSNFDPTKRYPVIEDIYPGPQNIKAPKSFEIASPDQALAELGFIVVKLDGMGGPFRSVAFHLASYGRLGQGGDLANHVAGIRQLAERYPYLDLDRVGIFGHSGGGFASTRAILAYPGFYKVAVSSSGNHDQRGFVAQWGERWQGLPDGDNYLEQVNAALAANLKGKLLLAYGDMDDNVPPALTLQLIHALIKANRDFDLIVMPNRNHAGVLRDHYFWRRRWDYFVRHLLHVEPPVDFTITVGAK